MEDSKEKILKEIIAEMRLEGKEFNLSDSDIEKILERLNQSNNKNQMINDKFKGKNNESK